MPEEIVRSYLVNPFLYSSETFCCGCGDYVRHSELEWVETGERLSTWFDRPRRACLRHYGALPRSGLRNSGGATAGRKAKLAAAVTRTSGDCAPCPISIEIRRAIESGSGPERQMERTRRENQRRLIPPGSNAPQPMTRPSMTTRRSLTFACFLTLAATFVPSAAASPPEIGEKARPFTLETLAGKAVSLESFTKSGPVVLLVLRGYPGYQCPLCTAQVRDFTAQAKAFADRGASVVMIYPGPAANLKKYAGEFVGGLALPANFTLLIDPDFAFTENYGLRWNAEGETAYPTTLVIDKSGTIRYALVSKSHGGRTKAANVLRQLDAVK